MQETIVYNGKEYILRTATVRIQDLGYTDNWICASEELWDELFKDGRYVDDKAAFIDLDIHAYVEPEALKYDQETFNQYVESNFV